MSWHHRDINLGRGRKVGVAAVAAVEGVGAVVVVGMAAEGVMDGWVRMSR
jgi:hypothetical protein